MQKSRSGIMATSSTKGALQFIKITDEDFIRAGILPRKPKGEETKSGCPGKEKLTFIKIDEAKFLEEQRSDAASDYNFSLKGTNSLKKKTGSNAVYAMKRTSVIGRRSSYKRKDIVGKALSNIGNVLNNGGQKNGQFKFIPLRPDMLESLDEESGKVNMRKKLFNTCLGKNKPSDKLFKGPSKSFLSNYSNSPLLDINKVELLLKENSSLKHLGHQTQLFPNTAPRLSIVPEERYNLTPSKSGNTSARTSTSSDTEFEAMEQMCNEQNAKDRHDEINEIFDIIKKDQEEFKKYKEANEKRMLDITKILKEIIQPPENGTIATLIIRCNCPVFRRLNNEAKQRSKLPLKRDQTPNKVDLRKKLLAKSLGNTPKVEKAEKMYNSLRDRYRILETPKFDKINPNGDTKNISMKLQEQCLMLLDTPQPK